jgi:ribonuclease D
MNNQWIWVDNNLKMLGARNNIRHAKVMCLDTEYDSFRYFRERLCLIQIKAHNDTYLIDPFLRLDMDSLGDVFADASILKIMHAGDNDIRLLKRDYDFEFNNIFDTQRAAAILGCQYLSLSTLIHQYLGIEFEKKKKLQRSQWEMRPLTEEQLHYAVQDTMFLEPLYTVLAQAIRQKDLTAELHKILEDMTGVAWNERPFNCMGFRKIKDNRCLAANQKQTLKELYEWRFQKAKKLNRAVFMILSDQDLIDICRGEPDSVADLKVLGKLSCEKIACYGSEIIEIMHTCKMAKNLEV